MTIVGNLRERYKNFSLDKMKIDAALRGPETNDRETSEAPFNQLPTDGTEICFGGECFFHFQFTGPLARLCWVDFEGT